MITITTTVSGDQIGRDLADDPEECAYALLRIALRADPKDLAHQLESILYDADDLAAVKGLGRLLIGIRGEEA